MSYGLKLVVFGFGLFGDEVFLGLIESILHFVDDGGFVL